MVETLTKSAVIFASGSVAIAVVLCFALRRHKRKDAAISWLLAANMAFLVAALGVLLRPWLGFVLTSGLVITAAYFGICFAFFAVMRAEEADTRWRVLVLFGVVGILGQSALAAYGGSVQALMLSSSAINSAILSWMLWAIWGTTRPRGARLATLLCLPFGALFLGYFFRLWSLITMPETEAPLAATLLIIVAMAWAAVILELAMIALRETQARISLRDALARVEAASSVRTRFLLGISHDLRTPLNGVLGVAELMRAEAMGPLPEAYRTHVDAIRNNGLALNELVEDLLLAVSTENLPEDAVGAEAIDGAVRDRIAASEARSQTG